MDECNGYWARRKHEDSLPTTKAIVLDTWTVPAFFSHWGEFTQEASQSPLNTTIWQKSPSNLPVMPRYIRNFNYTIRQEAKKSLLSYFPS